MSGNATHDATSGRRRVTERPDPRETERRRQAVPAGPQEAPHIRIGTAPLPSGLRDIYNNRASWGWVTADATQLTRPGAVLSRGVRRGDFEADLILEEGHAARLDR